MDIIDSHNLKAKSGLASRIPDPEAPGMLSTLVLFISGLFSELHLIAQDTATTSLPVATGLHCFLLSQFRREKMPLSYKITNITLRTEIPWFGLV